MAQDLSRRYRALAGVASGRPREEAALHLIREDAETSLCGIPRAQLSNSNVGEVFMCSDCLEWLPKRVAFSGIYPKIKP